MSEENLMRSIGLKVISVAAVAVLIFSALTIFLQDNEGESKARLIVDDTNEEMVVQPGGTVTHNIQVENDLGARQVIVNLTAAIYSVSNGGNATNWSVQFKFEGSYVDQIAVDLGDSEQVAVEVTAPSSDYSIHETATIHITGEDGYPPVSGTMNTTRCYQNDNYIAGKYLTLETMIGQNYETEIGLAPGAEQKKDVNPLNPTMFKLKIRNIGLGEDSYRISHNVGTPIRGENDRASDEWKVLVSPTSFIQDLESMDYTYIYVNVTSPTDATYGQYPIEITAASQSSNEDDTTTIKAVVPIPDLTAGTDDIVLSRFPVFKGQEMTINVSIENNGGALTSSFSVLFSIEDTEKEGVFNIIGTDRVAAISSFGEGYATITFEPDLSKKIKQTLTKVDIKIDIDSDFEIIESNEDNNAVNSELEIMRAPKSSSGYDASTWMVMTIVILGVVLAAGSEWHRRRKKEKPE